MSLLPSLLRVISSVDGECLVLQSGEQPHVFSSGGQVRLDPRGLTSRAVTRVIERMLSEDARRTLDETGTAQHEFSVPELPGVLFSAVAAQSGDDVWVEIRRRRTRPEDAALEFLPPTLAQVVEAVPPPVAQGANACATRAPRAGHPGLSRDVENLTAEPDGVILMAGPSIREEPSLAAALIELIDRTRRVSVAVVEAGMDVEERGRPGGALAATCAALARNPDVLVIDCTLDAALVTVALDAAASGRLVICGTTDVSARAALDAVIDLFPPEDHRVVRHALAHVLRGVVVQAMGKGRNDGTIAAREVLLATPPVSTAIREGRASELPKAWHPSAAPSPRECSN